MRYSWLVSGAYNNVYKSEDGKWVLKIQKKAGYFTDEYDNPTRSVLLWNTINAYLALPPARPVILKEGEGWVCPYIEGRPSTDEEIRDALVEIFHASGRIIVDPQCNNFLTMPDGRAVCIDVGLALGAEGVSIKGIRRRPSIVSDILAHHSSSYLEALNRAADTFPLTVAMVKALLLINETDPRIRDVRGLKDNPSLVASWARLEDPDAVRRGIRAFFSIPGSPPISGDISPSATEEAGSPALSEPSTLSDDDVMPMIGVPRFGAIHAPKAIAPRPIVKPTGIPAAPPPRGAGGTSLFATGRDEHRGESVEKSTPWVPRVSG
jgi:hypothetical protein